MGEDLGSIRQLLQDSKHGDPAMRLRRARHHLIQANTPAALIEQLGLEGALLALAQAFDSSRLAIAAGSCRGASSAFRPTPISTPVDTTKLNTWVYPRSLRWYQLQILDGNPPDVLIKGELYRVRSSRADLDRNHLLLQHLSTNTLWWWSSGECADGYLLAEQTLKPAQGGEIVNEFDGGVVVRSGNSNFAHFLWNELDPLLRLLKANRVLELVQDNDTIFNLASLCGVMPVPAEALTRRPSVRIGGTLVTDSARTLVCQSLVKTPDPTLPLHRCPPFILLGIRGPGRRELCNEVDFMIHLITVIAKDFGNPLILLDGFTYQNNNVHHPEAQQRERACAARIERIMEACPVAQLENISGLHFPAWLQRTEGVRFYVTHEGTMQHKAGWLRPYLPGLCLVGSAHAAAIATWHRRQCEGASTIATLPVHLFAQHPLPAGQPSAEERNHPFEIVDIPQAVELTLQEINRQLVFTGVDP